MSDKTVTDVALTSIDEALDLAGIVGEKQPVYHALMQKLSRCNKKHGRYPDGSMYQTVDGRKVINPEWVTKWYGGYVPRKGRPRKDKRAFFSMLNSKQSEVIDAQVSRVGITKAKFIHEMAEGNLFVITLDELWGVFYGEISPNDIVKAVLGSDSRNGGVVPMSDLYVNVVDDVRVPHDLLDATYGVSHLELAQNDD